MAQRKPAADDGKTQHQRFVEAARKLGTNEDPEAFRRIVRKVATAPTKRIKVKAAKKRRKGWKKCSAEIILNACRAGGL